ncbi:MAG: Ser-Thr-rich GPI-anchored membrane family protein [Ignavibacteriaceae bacterium]
MTLTTPNGGEVWQAGMTYNISWTDNINEQVKIDLYKDGLLHSIISSSTNSDGSMNWSIPASMESGSEYIIRITSVDNPSITDISDSEFTIVGEQITVTTPNGGESWQAGTTQIISWSDNIAENVSIELYKGGTLHSTISSSTSSDGSMDWSIPEAMESGSDYRIKITNVNEPSITDTSDAEFTIIEKPITIFSPNGGENWQAGSSQIITWSDNISENVTIELYKGGIFHSVIIASTSSDGVKSWDIPFELESGSDYTVKITSVDDPGIFDFSDSDFTIVGNQITVTSPNGGENWLIDTPNLITWTDNLVDNVELQLYKGGSFYTSISTSTASDGSYTWNIPVETISGSDFKIRITSVINSNIFDESDANFTLSNEIIVTAPNGGESWQAGDSHNIKWTDNITGNVKIELFRGSSFESEITPSTANTGNYTWNIPAETISRSNYKIKISSVDNSSVFDFSDANFEIFSGNITVVSPNGGESWKAGTSQTITWNDNINGNVTIDLYKGGSLHSVISTFTSSDGSKIWDIPFDIETGSDYKVKITSVDDPSITDFSDGNFTIIDNQITVTSPNGGESWLHTEDHVIRWTDNLTGNVEIQLLKNDQFYSSITTSTPSDGEYTWNIPGSTPSASDYKIKIISIDDGNVFDISDDNFTIMPAGTSQTITWTDDISGNVSIELYKSGVFNSTITSSTSSDGSYLWDIPANITNSSEYKVKITSISQPALFDMSNSNFTIFTADLAVTSPNGNENWQAGTSQGTGIYHLPRKLVAIIELK